MSVARSTLCSPNTLDPAKAAGKIVVCDRGVVDRVVKSDEVKRARGIGMVLVNVSESSSDADLHAVPTVHLNVPTSLTVRDYATKAGATATLTARQPDLDADRRTRRSPASRRAVRRSAPVATC